MTLGISFNNVDKSSFLGLKRDFIIHPLAASNTYFVNAADISAVSAGSVLTLTAAAAKPLFDARLPTVTSVDSSGTNLSITVRITGRRFGVQFYQDVTATGTGGGETVKATHLMDEITSVKVIAVANNAASDTCSVGFDDSWIGLSCPIRKITDLRMAIRDNNGTLDSGALFATSFTAARVKLPSSGIDLKSLFTTIAANNIYMIEYEAAGGQQEVFPRSNGLRFR